MKRSASPIAVNSKLSSMMFRQGGPIQIPKARGLLPEKSCASQPSSPTQDMRTHTHELANLKDWVKRFLKRNRNA